MLWYFKRQFLLTRPFCGCDLVTLTLVFDLQIENLNQAYIFWIGCSSILIFWYCTCVCCDNSFQWVPTTFTLRPWPLCFTYILKTLTWLYLLNGMYFDFDIPYECSLKQDTPMGTTRFDLVTFTLMFDLHIEILNFWIVCTRTWIFHIPVPSDKTLSWLIHFTTIMEQVI
jgi:hypothetical protein